jgi:hypothetical protein
MRDAERLAEVISSGIARLMDEHNVPPPPPSFWVEARRMIRGELRALNQQTGMDWKLSGTECLECKGAGRTGIMACFKCGATGRVNQ